MRHPLGVISVVVLTLAMIAATSFATTTPPGEGVINGRGPTPTAICSGSKVTFGSIQGVGTFNNDAGTVWAGQIVMTPTKPMYVIGHGGCTAAYINERVVNGQLVIEPAEFTGSSPGFGTVRVTVYGEAGSISGKVVRALGTAHWTVQINGGQVFRGNGDMEWTVHSDGTTAGRYDV